MKKKTDVPEDRGRFAKMTKEECLQPFKHTIAHPHLRPQTNPSRSHPGARWSVHCKHLWSCSCWQKYHEEPCHPDDHPRDVTTLTAGQRTHSAIEFHAETASERHFNWKEFFQDGLMASDEPLIDHKIARDPGEDEEQLVKGSMGLRSSVNLPKEQKMPCANPSRRL